MTAEPTRWVIEVLFGPCSEVDADDFLDSAATYLGGSFGAALSLKPYSEDEESV